ncbi:MAG: ABC transporter ATP-binding protein, partial [Anaerolinea sp.]|nr:ABC transporter ATP-binding protein [Anaerolinea sp.]
VAIRVENLGKRYRIGGAQTSYKTLRESLISAASAPVRWLKGQRHEKNTFWALQDVSFEIKQGEAVGIIGRNGAGKSTLLKILSRITKPTTGRVELFGRVGSLLEVGTGFHPELTGRENIYLNGAILGMSRQEIMRKFDEIVAFAEVEKFLDTPVKYYSSGMYVRLAFAVAAHLEPEILLVDEVLAVGDAAFQKKCLGKMGEVAQEGRTVLFVSHNMAAVLNLCDRAVLLDSGKIVATGATDNIVRHYLEGLRVNAPQDLASHKERQGRGRVRFIRVCFEDGEGNPIEQGISGQPLVIALEYQAKDDRPLQNCRISAAVYDSLGQVLFNCSSELTNSVPITLPPGGSIRCVIPRLPLSQGQYLVSLFIEVNREVEDWIQGAAALSVVDGDFFGTGKLYPEGWRGKGVLVPHQWIVDHK